MHYAYLTYTINTLFIHGLAAQGRKGKLVET